MILLLLPLLQLLTILLILILIIINKNFLLRQSYVNKESVQAIVWVRGLLLDFRNFILEYNRVPVSQQILYNGRGIFLVMSPASIVPGFRC